MIGIQLTPDFIEKRLTILCQPHHEETLRFIRHYGKALLKRILGWYQRADNEII